MGNNGKTCLISIDGADFNILEPQPFCPECYLHKPLLKIQLEPGEQLLQIMGTRVTTMYVALIQ
eukprot:7490526-Ditylum_brightwellii.AAC.1